MIGDNLFQITCRSRLCLERTGQFYEFRSRVIERLAFIASKFARSNPPLVVIGIMRAPREEWYWGVVLDPESKSWFILTCVPDNLTWTGPIESVTCRTIQK